MIMDGQKMKTGALINLLVVISVMFHSVSIGQYFLSLFFFTFFSARRSDYCTPFSSSRFNREKDHG